MFPSQYLAGQNVMIASGMGMMHGCPWRPSALFAAADLHFSGHVLSGSVLNGRTEVDLAFRRRR